ncbi:MFS transporter [Vibrio sp. S4M6]|uniref:MFS transporter n=1 Tax=Vibrio sinus TaxID=2946865 RepID=UPI00202A6ED7|nr:MFS transporter [Vibrio sinus]MCL9781731.1 MFS transporter [Vibrio sinus]
MGKVNPSLNIPSILGICLGIVAISIYYPLMNVSLPTITKELHAKLIEAQWIVNIFGIVGCAFLVTFGRLADIFGRKKIFVFGLACTSLAMIGDALSQSIGVIIALQFFTGLGNAIMLSASQAMMSLEFPEHQRGKAVGLWAMVIGISLAMGPIVGGMLVGYLGWRSIYWFVLTLALISSFLVIKFASESKNDHDAAHLDIAGTILVTLALGSLVFAIVEYGSLSIHWILTSLLVCVLSTLALVKVEKRADMPILRADLLKNPLFLKASINSSLLIFFTWSVFLLVPLFLESVAHYSVVQVGLVMIFLPLPQVFLSLLVGKRYNVHQAKYWIASGFVFAVMSAALLLALDGSANPMIVIASMASFGIATSLVWGPTTTVAVSTLSVQQAGIATGTYSSIQELGGNLGAAFGLLLARSAQGGFLVGFHHAAWLLIILMALGIFVALSMKTDHISEKNKTPAMAH